MVKSDPSHDLGWPPPRGDRDRFGRWKGALADRAQGDCLGPLEPKAVVAYRQLILELRARCDAAGLSVRELAHHAGLSTSVTSAALTGSAWPRWPTLEQLLHAAGCEMCLRTGAQDPRLPGPVIETLFELIEGEPELTGASIAQEIGVRRNTFYDLRRPGRAPSSATVFAFAAWFGLEIACIPV